MSYYEEFINGKTEEEVIAFRKMRRDICNRYEKTPNGFIMRMYRNMKSRVSGIQKKKAHLYMGLYLLPKDEFVEWIKSQSVFWELFEEYKNSGYDRKLCPTVDRIDSNVGYIISNMQILTHSENSKKANRYRLSKLKKTPIIETMEL